MNWGRIQMVAEELEVHTLAARDHAEQESAAELRFSLEDIEDDIRALRDLLGEEGKG